MKEEKKTPILPKKWIGDFIYSDHILLSYEIKYPTFLGYEGGIQEINEYYSNQASCFLWYLMKEIEPMAVEDFKDSQMQGFPVHKYQGTQNYIVPFRQGGMISVYIEQYLYTGGAHGNTLRTSKTWNIYTGEEIELPSFFPCIVNLEEKIEEEIIKQIEEQIQKGSAFYFDSYPELVRENFRKDHFYVSHNGIVIYFLPYEIAPYSSGTVEFLLPFFAANSQEDQRYF